MFRLFRYVLIIGLIFWQATAYAGMNKLSEEDGSPAIYPWWIKVTNGTLTDNGDGSASLNTGGSSVSDTAYDAGTWDGVTDVAPSKNAVRDKIETMGGGGESTTVSDGTSLDLTLAGVDITGEVIAQGDTGNIQYNNGDALMAVAGLNWDNANTSLQVRGKIDAKSVGGALTRLQVLPYAEDNVWLAYDMRFDGSDWKSSDAGSNYSIAKNGDQLRFYGDAGITVGDNISLEILGYCDYTGFWQFYNVIMTGHDGLDGGVWIYSEQGGTDYTLKLLPNATMTSDALFYFPADEPAADSLLFVSTGGVMSYKVIGTDVQAYDADLADLADGELTASKVGGVKDADYGEITVSGGTWTVDDSVAVTSWNLTTPTITTSLTTDSKTISEAEIGILDGGVEGTEILSTGEAGGTKFLREDGDGTCSWQTVSLTSITLDGSPSSDVTASGLKVSATVGENVAFGDILYMKSDGKYWKADADAAASMPAVVMATATISADASGVLLHSGYARNDAWNWTVGGLLYADTTTAGGMTQTAPSGTGDQVQAVGYAVTADIVYFEPDKVLVELT